MPRRASKTSFKPGHLPWNKKGKALIVCLNCSKEVQVSPYRSKKAKYCSPACKNDAKSKSGTRHEVHRLYCMGMSAKNIALRLGIAAPTVYSHVNRSKFRFRKPGLTRASIKNRFLKGASCVICGWNRSLDACHIVPAHKGGDMHISNLAPLCPNHHRLFDQNRLTLIETEKFNEWRQTSARCQ
jgi:HNH endonuclease